MRAQCGCQMPPRVPATLTRAALSAAESSTRVDAGPVGVGPGGRHQSRMLSGGVRDVEFAALDDVGVDALRRRRCDDLVDGRVERLLMIDRGLPAVSVRIAFTATGQLVGEPAAVSARRPESCEPTLQQGDAQIRLCLLEVVGRPHPGVAGTDDGNVDVDRSAQAWTQLRHADLLPPERDSAVGGHEWSPQLKRVSFSLTNRRRSSVGAHPESCTKSVAGCNFSDECR